MAAAFYIVAAFTGRMIIPYAILALIEYFYL